MLQQPPSDSEGVLLPAATPPEDHRCRVGPSRCSWRSGRFSIIGLPVGIKTFHHRGAVTSLAQLFTDIHQGFWFSQKCLTASGSYNWGPFLCPGEAAVRQLQAVHRALPVPDEEHASGFPLHQRRCHYTLRAHAEVKSHRHHITHSAVLPYQEQPFKATFHPNRHRETTVTLCGGSSFGFLTRTEIALSFPITHVKGNIKPFFVPHNILLHKSWKLPDIYASISPHNILYPLSIPQKKSLIKFTEIWKHYIPFRELMCIWKLVDLHKISPKSQAFFFRRPRYAQCTLYVLFLWNRWLIYALPLSNVFNVGEP